LRLEHIDEIPCPRLPAIGIEVIHTRAGSPDVHVAAEHHQDERRHMGKADTEHRPQLVGVRRSHGNHLEFVADDLVGASSELHSGVGHARKLRGAGAVVKRIRDRAQDAECRHDCADDRGGSYK
jgi:hypothetical protein